MADFLSRIDSVGSVPLLDYKKLCLSQKTDKDLQEILKTGTSSLQLKLIHLPDLDIDLYCDVSQVNARPFITNEFKRQVFDIVHSLSHPSSRTTLKLLTRRFVWTEINKDCKIWCRTCQSCQVSKVTRHNKSELQSFEVPTKRFVSVHT